MATRIQLRRDLEDDWFNDNPILYSGEIAISLDLNTFKIGDGQTPWRDLDYALSGTLEDYIPLNTKSQPGGVAALDSDGKVPDSQIPAGIARDSEVSSSITAAINNLVDGAPGALDTLNELAAAINDDSNYATTLTSALATKANLSDVTTAISAAASTAASDATSKANAAQAAATAAAAADATAKANASQLAAETTAATDATAKANAAQAAATAAAATDATAKANAAQLAAETTAATDATAKANAAQTAAGTEADTKVSNAIAALTKSSVGLANVDNTSDANKPVSTATQTALDLKLALDGGTMTGAITLHADPSSALHATTKQYVDNTASGIVAKPQVLGATTANIDAAYNNGTAGVGATLTHNTNGVFPSGAGGASGWAVGKGILVKNQTNKEENGRYYVSDMGSVSTPYVLTRCSYCDEASEIPGAYIFVQDGTLAGTGWIQVVADPATFTVGTDDIDVYQFSGSGTITAGTGITVNGNQVSIDAAVTAPLESPAFTGTVSGITKNMVGLGNVDNTSDANKPISSLTQSALNAKSDNLMSTDLTTSTSYSISSSDLYKRIEFNSTSPTTVTIPADITLNLPIGSSIELLQANTGKITVQGESVSVLIYGPDNQFKSRVQWSSIFLEKRAANSWLVTGDTEA